MAAFLGNVFMYVGLFGPLAALFGLVIYEGYLTFTGNSNALISLGGTVTKNASGN